MLTVACVLKSGGIYNVAWVERLRAGVARHLPVEHRFVCLSDVDVPCERVPLRHGWNGWWSKLELFKLAGPVLFFDLDTVIVGDLGDIARVADQSPIVMLADFYRPGRVASGVMGWAQGLPYPLYEQFVLSAKDYMGRHALGGDQACVEEMLGCRPGVCQFWQSAVPGQIVSYKVHCAGGIPPDARVVCLHGRPKFADMSVSDPVRLAWEMAA